MIRLTQSGPDVLLPVKVVPGASRSRLMGEWNGRLKIAVAAPPEKGKANAAVIELLAETLGLPQNRISLASAPSRPQKLFRIHNTAVAALLPHLPCAAAR